MLLTSQIKHRFFNKNQNPVPKVPFNEEAFNLAQFHAEFDSLYTLFLSNKAQLKPDSELIAYLRYLCDLLIKYYQQDYVKNDLQELLLKREQLHKEMAHKAPQQQNNPSSKVNTLSAHIRAIIHDYGAAFTSSSKLREHVSNFNAARSQWNYSLTLANHTLVCLKIYGIPDVFRIITEWFGSHHNPDEFINLLNKSRESLRILSVGLFAFRFMINLAMMTKHCIQATNNKDLSLKKVIRQELEKRGFTMASDLVWGIVNMLTNYDEVFHLSPRVTSPVVSAFLIFDILVLIGQWSVEANKYYKAFNTLSAQKLETQLTHEIAVINRQLDVLNDNWNAESAYYQFNNAGAILIAFSFISSLFCSGPLFLALLAGLSMLGNAIYNSANEYRQYQAAVIAEQREIANGLILADDHHYELLSQLSNECDSASDTLFRTLSLNAGATALLIVAAAISWPLALGLTLSCMIYRAHQVLGRTEQNNAPEQQLSRNVYRLFPPVSQETSIKNTQPLQLTTHADPHSIAVKAG